MGPKISSGLACARIESASLNSVTPYHQSSRRRPRLEAACVPQLSLENGSQDQACALWAHQRALLQHCCRPRSVRPFTPLYSLLDLPLLPRTLTPSQDRAQQPPARGHRHLRSSSQEGPLRRLREATQGHQAGHHKSKVLGRRRRPADRHRLEVIITGRHTHTHTQIATQSA